ncbi:MAG TPA: hypothetical protein VFJ16_08890 [Longimicrobium sp.]|nr:hypothetical protein [Longimicrobium sp.]
MRKMKLDIERLAVESFTVQGEDSEARGTVQANAVSLRCVSPGCDTVQLSCTGSCATGLNCQQVC